MTADDRESRLVADRLSDALEELGRLEAAREAQARVISRLIADRADLTTARDELTAVRDQLAAMRDELTAVRGELAAARDELVAVYALRTWRWSALPRRVYGWVRNAFAPSRST